MGPQKGNRVKQRKQEMGTRRDQVWPLSHQAAQPANDPSLARPAVEDSPEAGHLEPGSSSRHMLAPSRRGPEWIVRPSSSRHGRNQGGSRAQTYLKYLAAYP
jgi:hypothetical protein